MPSKKRRRPATAEDDAQRRSNIQSSHSTPLASFSSLPYELREMIIQLACRSPSPSTRSPFAFDVATAHSLSLASRELNAQVTPLLWGTVSITRPSALYALHQALLARPDRAKLITSLHLGPQDTLPSSWWPLSRTFADDEHQYTNKRGRTEKSSYAHWIATSLDSEGLPSGCASRGGWRWDRSTPGCRGAAIYDALRVIRDQLGLNFEAHGRSDPTTIAPVFEAQAALDIYLGAICRAEEEDPELARLAKPGSRIPIPCRSGECEHYPPLFITGAPKMAKPSFLAKRYSPREQPHCNAFVLPYAQILCHLARPGSVIDRFDHPLPLARSGFNVLIMAPAAAAAEGGYEPSKASYKLYSGTWDLRQHGATQWASHSVLREAAEQAVAVGKVEKPYAAAISLATFGSVLGLACGVLDRAVNVQSLSLTGYLESAILDKVFDSTLTRLSIGPALPCWDATLPVRQLTGVEELRICGRSMSTYEAWLLALETRRLKRLVWSLAEPDKHEESLADIMDMLLNTENGVPSAAASDPARLRKWSEARNEAGAPASPPLIIAHFHHTDIVKLLRAAPSNEIKAAWLAGRLTPGACRRLLVKENRRAFALGSSSSSNEASTGSDSSSSPIWEEMYREGREYWREGEGEAGQIEGEEEAEEEEEKSAESAGPGH